MNWLAEVKIADFVGAASDKELSFTCSGCGAGHQAIECNITAGEVTTYKCPTCNVDLATIVDTSLFPGQRIAGHPLNQYMLQNAVMFLRGKQVALMICTPLFSVRGRPAH